VPGVARVAGAAALQLGRWGARTYVRTGLRLARAAVDPDAREALARDAAVVAGATVDVVHLVLDRGVDDIEHADDDGHVETTPHPVVREPAASSPEDLRRRGAELLERSRDVWSDDQGHPAYSRILDELAPDEARLLRHLLQDGPQPCVDVRSGGVRGGTLLAQGMSMIGAGAGVRHVDGVPAYLNNLVRLGLVWISPEPLRDPMEYQVLEAQPDVLAALHATKFAKVVRRSIQLTPFGTGFCRACLVDDAWAAYPTHATPRPDEVLGTPPRTGPAEPER